MSASSSTTVDVVAGPVSIAKKVVATHVDPSSSSPTNTAASRADATMASVTAQIMKDKAHREHAEKLFSEKGNAGVQSALQKLIQETKKIESDLASKKKRIEKERLARSTQTHENAVIIAKARVTEAQCAQLAENARTWPERREKRVAELKETMARIRCNVDVEADKLTAEMDEKEAKTNVIDAENDKLQIEFDELKSKLDAEFAAYQDRHKVHDDRTTELRKSLEVAQDKTNHLRAETIVYGRELNTLEEQIVGYTETCKMYKDKFGQLENTAMTTAQIEEAIGKQKMMVKASIDTTEKDKKLDVAEKVQYDSNTKLLRQKIQQLKKKIGPAEKAKYLAEGKYREVMRANK